MGKGWRVRVTVIVMAATASTPALAFRCHSHLVKDGDPQARVLQLCGEPASTQRHVVYRSGITAPFVNGEARPGDRPAIRNELLLAERSLVEIVVEDWIYNLGPHRLMQRVRFENGIVTDIDYLDYGYTED